MLDLLFVFFFTSPFDRSFYYDYRVSQYPSHRPLDKSNGLPNLKIGTLFEIPERKLARFIYTAPGTTLVNIGEHCLQELNAAGYRTLRLIISAGISLN
jgi:hypothetical protein